MPRFRGRGGIWKGTRRAAIGAPGGRDEKERTGRAFRGPMILGAADADRARSEAVHRRRTTMQRKRRFALLNARRQNRARDRLRPPGDRRWGTRTDSFHGRSAGPPPYLKRQPHAPDEEGRVSPVNEARHAPTTNNAARPATIAGRHGRPSQDLSELRCAAASATFRGLARHRHRKARESARRGNRARMDRVTRRGRRGDSRAADWSRPA